MYGGAISHHFMQGKEAYVQYIMVFVYKSNDFLAFISMDEGM